MINSNNNSKSNSLQSHHSSSSSRRKLRESKRLRAQHALTGGAGAAALQPRSFASADQMSDDLTRRAEENEEIGDGRGERECNSAEDGKVDAAGVELLDSDSGCELSHDKEESSYQDDTFDKLLFNSGGNNGSSGNNDNNNGNSNGKGKKGPVRTRTPSNT